MSLAPRQASLTRACLTALLSAAVVGVLASAGPAAGATDPDFVLTTTTPTLPAAPGGSGRATVTVEGQHSYDGPDVAVSLTAAPPGVTGSCLPTPVQPTASCSLSVSVPSTLPPGSYPLVVTGDNGTAVRTLSLTLQVTPPAVLTLGLNRSLASIGPGGTLEVRVTLSLSGTPRGPITFALRDLPSGVNGLFSPASLSLSGDCVLNLSAGSGAVGGNFTIRINATDGTSFADAPFALQVVAPAGGGGPTGPGGSGATADPFPFWWLAVIGVPAAGAAFAAARARRRRRPSPHAPAPPGAPSQRGPAPHLVEEVFLLYHDGRSIFTRSTEASASGGDPELVGSMLLAVQDFVRDSFTKGAPVESMTYGDDSIMLERGSHVFLAATLFGEPPADFRDRMAEAVAKVEGTYAGRIEAWDGDRGVFAGVEALLSALWAPTAHLTREEVAAAGAVREVKVLSGIEFFQGFVRLKVAVANHTPDPVSGVTFDLDYNADVLRLHKVEPSAYRASGARVLVGSLKPGEKVALAYFFDPQICTTSLVEGSCRYDDAQGKGHVLPLKPRTADVVCPLFFTKEQANTAMLRRLIETELNQFDVRAYALPASAQESDLAAVFEALRLAVSAHDVALVRSFERRRPYSAEAWFYGTTQVKGSHVVIRAALSAQRSRAEFYAASVSIRAVTGLLAELHHTFSASVAERMLGLSLDPLIDEDVRATYASVEGVSLMIEGETAATDEAG